MGRGASVNLNVHVTSKSLTTAVLEKHTKGLSYGANNALEEIHKIDA